ncbi:hypothetical protein OGAPHI_002817 [Ogataea philodendri]|uniref:Deacetylase sirtuin-type domain-containing protein n=1 Tax=Ogataea philodendri TaxID=1378263 RepID=A0A9P8P7W4_9ASCO|nr:uncharacterized protein OGAPHI_002817 [Ogataea philodendri]KAH3667168.1 hypothetical protein OGAPHI_002817 [Ogataea philodendri]
MQHTQNNDGDSHDIEHSANRRSSTSAMYNLETFHSFLKSPNCKTILALVGAGLSASSGLSTFRGSGGLWKKYNAIDLATPDAFLDDPGLVWQFYAYRRHRALIASPNPGHYALSALSTSTEINFLTITQNVDGLSQRSNHEPSKLLEFHGSLFGLRCTNFSCSYQEKNNYDDPLCDALEVDKFQDLDQLPYVEEKDLPHCPACQEGLLRPAVVWFGESLPLQMIDKADEFIVRNTVDLILVIGTSRVVWPAASYVDIVRNQGGKVAIFNTESDEYDDDCWEFIGDSAETLPQALEPLIGKISPDISKSGT